MMVSTPRAAALAERRSEMSASKISAWEKPPKTFSNLARVRPTTRKGTLRRCNSAATAGPIAPAAPKIATLLIMGDNLRSLSITAFRCPEPQKELWPLWPQPSEGESHAQLDAPVIGRTPAETSRAAGSAASRTAATEACIYRRRLQKVRTGDDALIPAGVDVIEHVLHVQRQGHVVGMLGTSSAAHHAHGPAHTASRRTTAARSTRSAPTAAHSHHAPGRHAESLQ